MTWPCQDDAAREAKKLLWWRGGFYILSHVFGIKVLQNGSTLFFNPTCLFGSDINICRVGSIIFQTWNRPKDVVFKHMLGGCTSRMALPMLPRGQLEKEAAAIWAAKTYQLWNRKVFLRYLYILSQPRFAHNNVESSNHWKLQRGRLACPSY